MCFKILQHILSGRYVNFGVFRLYGDEVLDNAMKVFLKLAVTIPHSIVTVRTVGLRNTASLFSNSLVHFNPY